MIRAILLSTLVIFSLAGCLHKDEPKPEVKKQKLQKMYYKVPKLNPSFYNN